MTTPTHSHKAWTDKGGHVKAARDNPDTILFENDNPVAGFSLFLLNRPEAWLALGGFDEIFNPAYFEDNGCRRRLHLLGNPPIRVNLGDWFHDNSSTVTGSDLNDQRMHWCLFERNKAYYLKKWGGLPGAETYTNPFNRPPITKKNNEGGCPRR